MEDCKVKKVEPDKFKIAVTLSGREANELLYRLTMATSEVTNDLAFHIQQASKKPNGKCMFDDAQ